jgi:hypothetical protein
MALYSKKNQPLWGGGLSEKEKPPKMKLPISAGHQWLMPVILAIQEAEIRRFEATLAKSS